MPPLPREHGLPWLLHATDPCTIDPALISALPHKGRLVLGGTPYLPGQGLLPTMLAYRNTGS